MSVSNFSNSKLNNLQLWLASTGVWLPASILVWGYLRGDVPTSSLGFAGRHGNAGLLIILGLIILSWIITMVFRIANASAPAALLLQIPGVAAQIGLIYGGKAGLAHDGRAGWVLTFAALVAIATATAYADQDNPSIHPLPVGVGGSFIFFMAIPIAFAATKAIGGFIASPVWSMVIMIIAFILIAPLTYWGVFGIGSIVLAYRRFGLATLVSYAVMIWILFYGGWHFLASS